MSASRLVLPWIAAVALCASSGEYKSVSIDADGQLHILLASGNEVLPQKTPDQAAFGHPAISPDHRIVGWLAMYSDRARSYPNAELAGALVLYRAGRVLHRFPAPQVFWDWQFRDSGKQVAYSTGPTHGGAAEFVLRDVDSGRIIAQAPAKQGTRLPPWAQGLRY